MKKKIFVPLMVVAAVAMGYVGYGASGSQSEEEALLLENVEALARYEGGNPCPWGYGKYKSEKPTSWSTLETFTYCNGCSDKQGYDPQDKGCK